MQIEVVGLKAVLPEGDSLKAFASVKVGDCIIYGWHVIQRPHQLVSVSAPRASWKDRYGMIHSRPLLCIPLDLKQMIEVAILSIWERRCEIEKSPNAPPPLYPQHLDDLRKSGLDDQTIKELHIWSARPEYISRLIGWHLPDFESALVFPYPRDSAYRIKLFPPHQDGKGHIFEYLQSPQPGTHLYIPPFAALVSKDPDCPLTWTEGEIKAAKACQEGIPCVGIGGPWFEEGGSIVGLDSIAHVERQETLCPDSDVWGRPDQLQGIHTFGMELEARGATVEVVIIPPGPNGWNQGLDEFLMREGVEAFLSLKRICLKELLSLKLLHRGRGGRRVK